MDNKDKIQLFERTPVCGGSCFWSPGNRMSCSGA